MLKTKYWIFLFISGFYLACSVDQTNQDNTKGAERDVRNSSISQNAKGAALDERMEEEAGVSGGEGIVDINTENTESYDKIVENPFFPAKEKSISTFSIDVDNASYSNIRRMVEMGSLPPKGAVRIEEMVNYFTYDYPQPKKEHPFSITTEISDAPWNDQHKLLHIGLQGKELDYKNIKSSNLVLLIDASGSMSDVNKLPLLQRSLSLLLDEMDDKDRIAIVAYAGAAGLVLPSTSASQKQKILGSLNNIAAGGSTAGGEGIELAYKVAKENLIADGNNRVILATDGDFNVGAVNQDALVKLIEEKRKDNIYLTICGFGMGNYKDDRMEAISNVGNGNYFYIDNIREAQKVFVREMRANMFTIAKDVKIQIDFNPDFVKAYRLIGYENRMLNTEDFDDDKKDAGELGAGHTVTALYELILSSSSSKQKLLEVSKEEREPYKRKATKDEIVNIRFRYKPIQSDKSILMEKVAKLEDMSQGASTSENFRFSAAVAAYGMLLLDSEYKGKSNFDMVLWLAREAKGKDTYSYRQDFTAMVEKTALLKKTTVN